MPRRERRLSDRPAPPPGPDDRWALRRHAWLALRLLVSAGLLAALLSQIDLGQVLGVASAASPALLALVLAMFFAERCLGAYRWHLLIRTQHDDVTFATTLRATFLGGFVGTFLPGSVGVEAVRVVAMARAASDLAMAASSVLFDRILGSLALVGIVLVALALTPQPVPAAVGVAAWSALAVIIVVSTALLLPAVRDRLARCVPQRFARLRHELRRFGDAISKLVRRPVTLMQVSALSVLFQLLRVGIAPVVALALGLDVPVTLFLIYVPIIMFLMMLPVSIGGLGVREAAFVYFFGVAYISPEQAFTLSLVIGAFTLVTQLPGAVVCITGVRPRRRPRDVEPATAPADAPPRAALLAQPSADASTQETA